MLNTDALNVLGTMRALLRSILLECPVPIPASSLEKDIEVASRRLESEGLPFVTTQLPRLGKAVDRALETGVLEPIPGFGQAHGSALPAFGQDVLRYLFEDDGTLRSVAEKQAEMIGAALRHLRTVCFFAYKLDTGYSSALEGSYEEAFIATDESLPGAADLADSSDLLEVAAYEVARLIGDIAPRAEELLPRHGPGAVAGGERDEEKYQFDVLPLKTVLASLSSLFFVNDRHRQSVSMDATLDLMRSRLAFVPKDSRGPRVIAIEPKELQWLQQAMRESLVPRIVDGTRGRINFSDQSVNADLALVSSKTRKFATLDMKDASDRVSLALAERVIPPSWMRMLHATRSETTELPSGGTVVLKKLSSMGSATTFPIEALIFWAVSVAAISQHKPGNRQWVRDHVYAYGDDIIVPREHAVHVMDALESVGLLVNRSKSFIDGFFRESCGMDAYYGVQVTPIRMKRLPPKGRSDVNAIAAACDLANRLDQEGYAIAAECLYRRVEAFIGPLPYGTPQSGFLHKHYSGSDAAAFQTSREERSYRWRMDRTLHRVQAKVWVVEKARRTTVLDGWSRLLRNLTQGSGDTPDQIVPTRARLTLRKTWRYVTR